MIDLNLQKQHEVEFGPIAAFAFAPGRINLIGEYTDFNNGYVLPMPLDLGVSITLGHRDDGQLLAQSTAFDGIEARKLDKPAQGRWSDFLLGAIQYSGVKTNGISASVSTTLPVGASVSSSAAIEVAMLRALRTMFDLRLSDDELARLAQKIENEFIGVASGLMDQMVISVGAARQALFFDTFTGETETLAMFENTALLTIHSGITRKLTENAYNDRRASCERACADMGVPSLRQADLEMLVQVNDRDDRRKAEHVLRDNNRVLDCVAALKSGDVKGFGQIMFDGHQSLSQLFEVSKPEMDAIIDLAKSAGAIGARMTGAGFGGCVIVLTTLDEADRISSAITTKNPNSWVVSDQRF